MLIGPPLAHYPRALLVGEAPAPSWGGDPRALLTGPAFRRLAQMVMWPGDPRAWRCYLTTFARVNVLQRPLEGKWPAAEARAWGEHVLEMFTDVPLVVLGRRAADALGLSGELPSFVRGDRVACLLPHPSGRCRLWNQPDMVELCQKTFARLGI
jgi:hypothetical protein